MKILGIWTIFNNIRVFNSRYPSFTYTRTQRSCPPLSAALLWTAWPWHPPPRHWPPPPWVPAMTGTVPLVVTSWRLTSVLKMIFFLICSVHFLPSLPSQCVVMKRYSVRHKCRGVLRKSKEIIYSSTWHVRFKQTSESGIISIIGVKGCWKYFLPHLISDVSNSWQFWNTLDPYICIYERKPSLAQLTVRAVHGVTLAVSVFYSCFLWLS